MKYIFSLGVTFKKYKRPLKITISSKQMIDQLLIDQDITGVLINNKRFPKYKIPNKVFFYEIDEHAIGNKFTIQVECEDNNHTNGFMSNTSLLQICSACLIPKNFLFYYFSKTNTEKIKQLETKRFYDPWPEKNLSTELFNCWPYQRRNWTWFFEKQNYDLREQQYDQTPGWIGGNFNLEIDVIKKHGAKMFNPYVDKNKTYGEIITTFPLYEKSFRYYYQLNMCNEDQ